MHYRCFACPGCGVSEIGPGRAAGRTTRRRATVLSANRRGGRRSCCPSRPHAIRTGPAGGPPRESPTGLPCHDVADRRGRPGRTSAIYGPPPMTLSAIPENERANVMSTFKQNTLDGRAERRPAHTGSTGGLPLKPSTPQGSAQGPSPQPARPPATVADITRPSPATVGEYDHVAAAAYLR